jgi:hypothetical protein
MSLRTNILTKEGRNPYTIFKLSVKPFLGLFLLIKHAPLPLVILQALYT